MQCFGHAHHVLHGVVCSCCAATGCARSRQPHALVGRRESRERFLGIIGRQQLLSGEQRCHRVGMKMGARVLGVQPSQQVLDPTPGCVPAARGTQGLAELRGRGDVAVDLTDLRSDGSIQSSDLDLSSFAVRGAEHLLTQTPSKDSFDDRGRRGTAGAAAFADGAGRALAVGVSQDAELANEVESPAECGDTRKQPVCTMAFAGLLLDGRPLVRTVQALLLYSCERSGAGVLCAWTRELVLVHVTQARL